MIQFHRDGVVVAPERGYLRLPPPLAALVLGLLLIGAVASVGAVLRWTVFR